MLFAPTHKTSAGGEGKLEDTQGAEGWRSTGGRRRAAMARLDGFLWSLVETQETRVQTGLPDNYRLEISATSQEVAAIEDQLGTLLDHEEQ